jgi:hypothetical protein
MNLLFNSSWACPSRPGTTHGEKSIHRGYQNRISKAAKELHGRRGSVSLPVKAILAFREILNSRKRRPAVTAIQIQNAAMTMATGLSQRTPIKMNAAESKVAAPLAKRWTNMLVKALALYWASLEVGTKSISREVWLIE